MHHINNTLAERGSRYGEFDRVAEVIQGLKREMYLSPNWDRLPAFQKEALEMTVHKIGRILNGDPAYEDSWIDIIGYIQLVLNIMKHGQSVPNLLGAEKAHTNDSGTQSGTASKQAA